MTSHQTHLLAADGGTSPFIFVIIGLMFVMALVQTLRPQLLWRANRPFQKPFVKDYDATEPSAKGYAVQRMSGVVVMVALVVILVMNL